MWGTEPHTGATWIKSGWALKEKAVGFLQSQIVSPTPEHGLLLPAEGSMAQVGHTGGSMLARPLPVQTPVR